MVTCVTSSGSQMLLAVVGIGLALIVALVVALFLFW